MALRRISMFTVLLFACFLSVPTDAFSAQPLRTDAYGDPLPPGALLRLGTVRWRACARALTFTPDGKTLITAEYEPPVVRFWDVAAGKETSHFQTPSWAIAFALSPDGTTLALSWGWESKGIVFVSVPAGKELRRFEQTDTYYYHLEYSTDGKTLAATGNDSVVRLFEVKTGVNKLHLTANRDWRSPPALSSDGKQIALPGPKNTLRVVDVANEKEIFKQQLRPDEAGPPLNVHFSPDGKMLAWMGEEKSTFALWEVSSGKAVLQFRVPSGKVASVLFSPDGKRIASVQSGEDGDSIHLWDAATGKEIRQFVTPAHAADTLAFSPDGKRLAAVGDDDGVVHLWDVETGKELNRIGENQGGVVAAAFSPDGRTALTGCGDRMIRMWDAQTGAVTRRINVEGVKASARSYSIDFSNDRTTAAITDYLSNAELWDLNSGKRRAKLDGGKEMALKVVFTADGKTLASRGSEPGIQLWDATTGKKVRLIPIDNEGLGEFAFSPNGKTLLAERSISRGNGARSIELSLWDAVADKELSKWPTQMTWAAFAMRFSPDGSLTALSDGWKVHLWSPAQRKEWAELTVPKNGPASGVLSSTAFSPDGRILAAAGDSGAIYLWEVNTAKVRRVFTGHRARVTSLDFSPDGARLISGSHDATALIWDLTGLADNTEAKTLSSDQLAALWRELAGEDAGKAWRAGWRLTADPMASVPFLRKHIYPAAVDADRIAKLLAALDADTFKEREAASHELAKLGDSAGPALRKALDAMPPLEAERRMKDLLNQLDGPVALPDAIRELRGVEVLEHIGTAEARNLLNELAKGAEGSRLTRDAKASLARLTKRSS